MTDVLLIGALRRELGWFAGRAGVESCACGTGARGVARAERALDELHPSAVLHVGFAGGLRAGLAEGDLMLVTEVFASGAAQPPLPCALVPALRERLARLRHRLGQGALVTVDHFVHSAAEKAALAERHHVPACDMEAAGIASACAARGIPYAGVRAISDGADRDLLPGLRAAGRLRPRPLATALLKPTAPLKAARMLRGARRAEQALALAGPGALDVVLASAPLP